MIQVDIYEGLLHTLIMLALAASFLIVGVRRMETGIKVLAGQSLLLALATVVLGLLSGIHEKYLAAFLTGVVHAGLIPYILHKVAARVGACREVKSYVNVKMSFVICAGLVLTAYSAMSKVFGADYGFIDKTLLLVSISMMLIGLFVMMSRKLAIMQVVGLLMMENGLYLAGAGLSHGIPLVVELGILLDILVAVLIMGILAFRIDRSFDSIDTEHLKNLRG